MIDNCRYGKYENHEQSTGKYAARLATILKLCIFMLQRH